MTSEKRVYDPYEANAAELDATESTDHRAHQCPLMYPSSKY